MLEELKKSVCRANLELVEKGVVIYTWGNVIVVKNHGPFAWGNSPENAVYNAVVLEKVAEMDIKTLMLNPNAEMKQYVLDKHYMRKHGPNAYYGQK